VYTHPIESMRFGYSILLFGGMGFLMQGIQPLFKQGKWQFSALLSGIAVFLYLISEYAMINFIRGEFVLTRATVFQMAYTAVLTMLFSPIVFWLLFSIAAHAIIPSTLKPGANAGAPTDSMEPGYRLRLYLLTALVLVGFGVLLTRLHEFQIERRNEFLDQVPGNRTVTVREPGIRGEITDRNGITLAKNLRKYEVSFNLDEVRDAFLAQHANEPKFKRIVAEDGMTRDDVKADIVSIVQDGKESTIGRLRTLGLAKNYNAKALRTHFLTHGGLIPFSYRTDLDYNGFAKIAEHNLSLPGVYVGMVPQRQYPYGALASHVLGYIKPWDKRDIPESAARAFNHYVGDDKGADGVEATMDDLLRGPEGRKTVVKDEKGRTIKMSDYAPPGTGAKVVLTIDAPVQYLLENTLRLAGRAAGVVMDVNTGEVLAMASVPDYNPNDFIPASPRRIGTATVLTKSSRRCPTGRSPPTLRVRP
jgi:cell division protein FtsI/penicillin-binding protein 2